MSTPEVNLQDFTQDQLIQALIDLQKENQELRSRSLTQTGGRTRSPKVVVDGLTLEDRPESQRYLLKKLVSRTKESLTKVIPARLKLMGITPKGGWTYHEGFGYAPYIMITDQDGQDRTFEIQASYGDWTAYYLREI